jgi:hypothetical protein
MELLLYVQMNEYFTFAYMFTHFRARVLDP